MTNDVLKRLRSSEYEVVCPCGDLRKAAADEIEQLRLERHQLRNELTAARLALEHLTNGYKFPAECCRIAREGLAGAAVEPEVQPFEITARCECGRVFSAMSKQPFKMLGINCPCGRITPFIRDAEKSSAPLSHIADCQCKNPWTDTFYEVGKCPLHGSRTAE